MPLNLTASPLPAAVEYLGRKAIVPTAMRTADWANIPAQLRARSQFSAGVEDARFLQTVQDKLMKVVQLQREQVAHGDAFVNRDSFITDMRKIAIEEGLGGPGTPGAGGMTDLQSSARLGLIYDMQVAQAQNFARWKMDQDSDILDAFPAQELLRLEERVNKRDWRSRWIAAGGMIFNGLMVALKNDLIWVEISTFRTPWPPFDWGSGMGVRDVDRRAAIALGLIAPAERVAPESMGFNDSLEVDVSAISSAFLDRLSSLFGPLISIAGNKLKWLGS